MQFNRKENVLFLPRMKTMSDPYCNGFSLKQLSIGNKMPKKGICYELFEII